jgi:hypothetical protein
MVGVYSTHRGSENAYAIMETKKAEINYRILLKIVIISCKLFLSPVFHEDYIKFAQVKDK